MKKAMDRQFSLYLDFWRFTAAVLVVLSHLTHFDIAAGEWSNSIPTNGRDAVIVFFVLSGLVIYYSTKKAALSLSEYIVARAVRIYSVALPVLLLTVCVDLVVIQFNPQNYTGLYQYEKLYIYIPFHLAFLGEIWTLSEQPFTVPPYWSLGYEVWYYALFGLLFFYKGMKRIILFILLFLAVGYKLWILFPIWLAGILLLFLIERTEPKQWLAWLLFIVPIFMYGYFKWSGCDVFLIEFGQKNWPFESLSLGSASKYGSDYVVCLLFLVHLYGARFIQLSWVFQLQKPITLLASYTFTLYLVHAPVMKTIEHNFAINTQSFITTLLVLFWVALMTYIVGTLTEKRKMLFKPGVVACISLIKKLLVLCKMGPLLKPNR